MYTKTLTGQQFRLISILPAREANEIVNCEVSQYEIGRSPNYEPLSYVWGDPNITSEITVNRKSLWVTESLRNALARLRFKDSNRMIWADAICINQKNEDEKNHQVPLMGRIYANAIRVVVWLGHATYEECSAAAQSLQIISDACRAHRETKDYTHNTYRCVRLPQRVYESIAWKELQKMFSVPWFGRVWCIQEAQLPSSAIIMWGEQEIPQANVYLSAAWINQRRAKRYYTSLPNFQAINWSCALNMFDISKLGNSILEILVTYREFQATDSRDMVYALLNLMKPEVVAKKLIRVDYRRSAADVYADVAIAVIYELPDLQVLSHVRHLQDYDGYDGFTSWAPRWDIRRKNNKLPLMGSLDTGTLTVCKRLPVCLAAGLRNCSNVLRLRGLSFYRVSAVKTTMSFMSLLDTDGADAYYPIADIVDEVLGHSSTFGSTESNRIVRELARTLTAGLTKDDHGNWLSILTLNEDDINKHYCGFFDYVDSHFPILYQKYAATFDQIRVPEATSDDALRYAQLLALVCDCRCLFYTANGSYGLGPGCMREGDLVVVLFGGDTPYVIRPKGEGYLFLGQAYVDELMQGKLVDDMEAGRVNEEDFCLL